MDGWPHIDDLILQRKILPAMQAIRVVNNCDLRTAIDIFSERLSLLWDTRADEFNTTREEYGEGVYT